MNDWEFERRRVDRPLLLIVYVSDGYYAYRDFGLLGVMGTFVSY